MVAAVRRGASQRAVARRFGVSLRTVQVWVTRAGSARLDRVDWTSRPVGVHRSPQRTPGTVEDLVLECRQRLRRDSALGEYGAVAIHRTLEAAALPGAPAVRTIGRILERRGAVDRRQRVRRPAPPRGWHLPAVARREAELDHFDIIEDLKLQDGPLLDVLTAVSLHGGLPGAWPLRAAYTRHVLRCIKTHWQTFGCPAFAQFDNDTRFQGPHQYPDVFGRVVRFCLQLGVTPVFTPPREFGLQNASEHFNGLYEAKVWRRFHFDRPRELTEQTNRYLTARRQRLAARIGHAPPRCPWPGRWTFRPAELPAGRVIFIRRTSEQGTMTLLGHCWQIAAHWPHRLVRAEVDLAAGCVSCYELRRNRPDEQPLLSVLPYHYPRHDLRQ